MKKFFCDLGCFFLVLALVMVVGAMVEGTVPFWPAAFALCCISLFTGALYQLGFYSLGQLAARFRPRQPVHAARPARARRTAALTQPSLKMAPAAGHSLGAA